MNDKKRNDGYYSSLTGLHRTVPIILGALAVFVSACYIAQGTGAFGDGICSVLLGLFSAGAYAIPALLVLHAIFYAEDIAKNRTLSRVIFSFVIVLIVSGIQYTVDFWSDPRFAPVEFYELQSSGGFIGSIVAFAITTVIGPIGLYIISATTLVIYIAFFHARGDSSFSKAVFAVLNFLLSVLAFIEREFKRGIAAIKKARADKQQRDEEKRSSELLDDQFFDVDNGMRELKIDQLGISESRDSESFELNPTLQNQVYHKSAVEDEPEVIEETYEEEIVFTPRKKPVDLTYGLDEETINAAASEINGYAEAFAAEEEPEQVEETPVYTAPTVSNGLDESADAVFTKDFDPFNFATAEKLAAKSSSRVQKKNEYDGINEMAKPLSAVTEEDLNNLRRKEEAAVRARDMEAKRAAFEERKRQLLHREEVADTKDYGEEEIKPFSYNPEIHKDKPKTDDIKPFSYNPDPKNYAKTFEFNSPNSDTKIEAENKIPLNNTDNVFADDAEAVAAHIAKVIQKSNPTYIRSANEMTTYMTVKDPGFDIAEQTAEEPVSEPLYTDIPLTETTTDTVKNEDDFTFEQYVPAESPLTPESNEAAFTSTEDIIPAEIPTEIANDRTPLAYEPIEADADGDVADETDAVPAVEPAASYEAEAVATVNEALTPEPAPEVTVVAEPAPVYADSYDEVVETITSGYDEVTETVTVGYGDTDPAPEAQVSASETPDEPAVSEPETVEEDEPASTFMPYTPPAPDPITETPKRDEDVMVMERTMLSPAPKPSVSELRDSRYTVISESMPLFTEEPEQLEIPEDNISWSTEENVMPETEEAVVASDEGTVFDFGADDADDEDTDEPVSVQDDSDMIFAQDDEDTAEDEGEIPPEEQNPEVLKQREMFPILDRDDSDSDSNDATEDAEDDIDVAEMMNMIRNAINGDEEDEAPAEEDISTEGTPDEEDDTPPFDVDEPDEPEAEFVVPVTAPKPKKEEKPPKPDYSNYVFPSIELLGKDEESEDEDIQSEIQENADKLIDTLASFNVTASIKGVDRGPRITRYEVVPAKGVKVSNVMNLQDDIALNLAAGDIRMEAPIPGKSAIGVEIPNKHANTVRLRDLIESEEFASQKSKTAVCIGKDVAGCPVFGDIAKMPHLLIAGATGMGKSVCINSLMISMLYKARPDELKFIMIDPKQVEFTMYNGIPHLLVPVVSDSKQAAGALMWAVEQMEKRYELIKNLMVRNIDAYNQKVTDDPSLGEVMPRIVIVIDEFADLMLQVRDPVENLVMSIAQKARAAGIHLIVGTQRPSVNVITGTIKANIPSRMSCKVASNVDSRTILETAGAEKLLNRGDMLFSFAGAIKPIRVQGAFVSDSEVEAIMSHIKSFSDGNSYDSTVMEEIERAAQKCSKKGAGGGAADYDDDDGESGEGYLNDRQFLDAVEVAVNSGKISTSLLQRKLSIGYGKAAKFVDVMEDMGIVGESNGQRPRDVLISPDEWREKLSRTMID